MVSDIIVVLLEKYHDVSSGVWCPLLNVTLVSTQLLPKESRETPINVYELTITLPWVYIMKDMIVSIGSFRIIQHGKLSCQSR